MHCDRCCTCDSRRFFFREDDDEPSDLRVSLITYDSRIHLYDLSPTLSRPHMMVLTDTGELELPVQEGLLVPLRDCRHTVQRYQCPPLHGNDHVRMCERLNMIIYVQHSTTNPPV